MFKWKPTGHPDCNQVKTNWLKSEMGIVYKRLRPTAPYLQWSTRLDTAKEGFIPFETKSPSGTLSKGTLSKSIGKGTVLACSSSFKSTPKLDDVFLPVSLCHRDQSEGMIALALLDTGARYSKESNLISRKLDKIVSKGGQTFQVERFKAGFLSAS